MNEELRMPNPLLKRLAACGQDVMIWDLAHLIDPERISMGDSVIIDDFAMLMAGEAGIDIGSFCHVAAYSSVVGGGEFTMADCCSLSGGVKVYTGNEDYMGGSMTNPAVPYPYRIPERSYVRMGKHAIVGANSVVLPGVTIGEGCAVGACSLVTRDLPPWTICYGQPARPHKDRPRNRILQLEAYLREALYDNEGRYIPKAQRERL